MRPGSAAIISIIAGEYLGSVFWGSLTEDAEPPPQLAVKALALAGMWMITILNCLSTKAGTRMGDVFLLIKLISLMAITIIGIVVAITGFSVKPGGPSMEWKMGNWFEGSSRDPGAYAVALYAGLWAFDGWDNVCELYYRGDEEPGTRPTAGDPLGHASGYILLPPGERFVLFRITFVGDRLVDNRCGTVRYDGFRIRRRYIIRTSGFDQLSGGIERHNIYIGKTGVRCRKTGVPTQDIWKIGDKIGVEFGINADYD
ncbi:hypothetical protein TWF192_000931 [Orbilia oligospora]|nr:hypothetical protein TWF192_000931 [Orbilia oligospora]